MQTQMTMNAKHILKSFSFQAITELSAPCSKAEISKKVLEIARECDALTDDLIFAFKDIGWGFTELKMQGLIANNGKSGKSSRWFLTV